MHNHPKAKIEIREEDFPDVINVIDAEMFAYHGEVVVSGKRAESMMIGDFIYLKDSARMIQVVVKKVEYTSINECFFIEFN